MKRILTMGPVAFLLGLGLAVIAADDQEAAGSPLLPLRAHYEAQLAKINASFDAAVTNLQSQYLKSLGALEKSLQDRGNLEALLAAKKERERFSAELRIEERHLSPQFPDLRNVQNGASWAIKALPVKKAKDIVAAAEQYRKGLTALQEKLTKAGSLDSAIEVKTARDAIEARPEVSAARFVLAEANAARAVEPSPAATNRPPAPAPELAANAEAGIRRRFDDLCKAVRNQDTPDVLAAFVDPPFVKEHGTASIRRRIFSVCAPLRFVEMKANMKIAGGTVKVDKKNNTATLAPRITVNNRTHDMNPVTWKRVGDDWFLDLSDSRDTEPPSTLVIPRRR